MQLGSVLAPRAGLDHQIGRPFAAFAVFRELPQNRLIPAKCRVAYEEFNKKMEEYLDKFSDRCLEELKLETETLKDNPRSLYHSISTFARRMQKGEIESVDTEKARKEAEAKVKRALRFHPAKRRKFKFILKNARFTVKIGKT